MTTIPFTAAATAVSTTVSTASTAAAITTGAPTTFTTTITGPIRPVPLRRTVAVELRKSFDTRAGFWLLIGAGLAALAASATVIAFAPAGQFSHGTFTKAIGYPLSVILPIIAVLSVTSEWSQRTGLTTFTLVPHRGRVLLAKAVAAVAVAVAATILSFAVGAAGTVAGSAITGEAAVWDLTAGDLPHHLLATTLMMLVGFTLGVLIRNSPGAIVAYFVYAFVAPTLATLLALFQDWFRDLRPWIDLQDNQDALYAGALTGEQWLQLAGTVVLWVFLPLTVGVLTLIRSDVK